MKRGVPVVTRRAAWDAHQREKVPFACDAPRIPRRRSQRRSISRAACAAMVRGTLPTAEPTNGTIASKELLPLRCQDA
jgi:hypothetical protein